MNPSIQSGTHPDTEILTAFAEHLLGNAEREEILAHMATCGRCREVVFLAQRAMDAEERAQVSAERTGAKKASRGWFRGWRWAWIPVAALAGFVGVAVVQHMRHAAPEQQMARNAQQAEAIQGASAAKAANGPVIPQAPRRDEATLMSADRQGAATLKAKGSKEEEFGKALDEKKAVSALQKDESKQAVDAMSASVGVAGGAIHGALTARAKSSPIGGPMAQNQMQQQNNAAQQNALEQAQGGANETSNKASAQAARAALGRPGAMTESVEVQPLQPAAAPSPAAPAPEVAAQQTEAIPVTGQSPTVEADKVAKSKGAKVKLPSGLEALSVAASTEREIAIDTAGALYLSEDKGTHWQAVETQWSGRAVLVRTRSTGADSAGLLKAQAAQFELVNDRLQTWLSVDGKRWTAQVPPGK